MLYVINHEFWFFNYGNITKFCISIHFALVTWIYQSNFQQLFIPFSSKYTRSFTAFLVKSRASIKIFFTSQSRKMEFEFNKFFFFVVFAFWILAESCYKTLKAKLGTNDFSIRILVFADFLQITKFEMSHLEKLDVVFNKF